MTTHGAHDVAPDPAPVHIPTGPTRTGGDRAGPGVRPPGAPAGPARGPRLRRAATPALAAVLIVASVAGVAAAWANRGNPDLVTTWRTPPGPSVPAAPPVASSAPAETITLSGVGDVIMGTAPGLLPPRTGDGMFAGVHAALASDLAMGNLEEALTDDLGVDKCGSPATPSPVASGPAPGAGAAAPSKGSCYQFHLPPSYARVLHDGGFSLVNLANNHTMDEGATGLRNTRAALSGAGVLDTGAPGQITIYRTRGISVAVIGVAPYPWCQSLLDIQGTAALVRRAASQADLVVVQMQAGAEGADRTHVRPGMETFLGEQRGDPYRFAHAMIDAGADLIVGHGPHVMRGMEFYKGRLIAYSMGNFTGYRVLSSAGDSGVGGILRVTLARDGGWVGGSLVPTRMVNGGLPALDPSGRAISLVGTVSRQDFSASAAVIAPDGTITAPGRSAPAGGAAPTGTPTPPATG